MKKILLSLFLLATIAGFSQTRISDMPITTNPYGAYVPVLQSGVNKRLLTDSLKGIDSVKIIAGVAYYYKEGQAHAIGAVLTSESDPTFNAQLATKTTDNLTQGAANKYYSSTLFNADLATKTTDNVTQGSLNKYYSSSLFRADLATKTTDSLNEGNTNKYYHTSLFNTDLATKTADNIAEGATNKYYTTTKFNADFNTKTTDNLPQGTTNKYYSSTLFNTDFGTKNTDALAQGSVNKYYATSLFNTDFGAKTTDALAQGSTNKYYSSSLFNTDFAGKNTDALAQGTTNKYYSSTLFNSDLATKSTDNLAQGSTNKYYSSSLFNADFGAKTTTDLPEGTNKYYTSARFRTDFLSKTTDTLPEGTVNKYYTTTRFNTDFSAKTTDNLPQGSTNKYYATSLFNADLAGKTTDNLTEGTTNKYYTTAHFNTDFGAKTTDALTEGATNKYYTSTRFNSDFAGKTTDGLTQGTTNKYYSSSLFNSDLATKTTDNLAQGSTNKYYSTSLFNTDLAGKTTDNLAQGTTNKYYSSSLFNSDFNTKTTTNLPEGTNKYYTDARVTTVGDGRYPQLSSTYNDPAWMNTLAWSKITSRPTTVSGYGITDALTNIGGLVSAGTNVTVTGSGTGGSPYVISASGGSSVNDSVNNVGISSVADLRATDYQVFTNSKKHNSNDKPLVRTLGYYTPGDGGGAVYYWSDTTTAADDSSFYIKPASVSGAGRWILHITDGTVNMRQIGAKADNSFDNKWTFKKALASSYPQIYFPQNVKDEEACHCGNYYMFNDSVDIYRKVTLYGDGDNKSVVCFDPAYDASGIGFHFKFASEYSTMANMQVKGKKSGFGAVGYNSDRRSGILNEAITYFRKVWVTSFDGDGFTNWGDAGSGSNCSLSSFTDCHATFNGRSGFFFLGGDANACLIQNCVATENRRFGFCDSSFLGNTFISNQAATNGVYYDNGFSFFIKYGGFNWHVIANNTNVKPGVTSGWQSYWQKGPATGGADEWDSTTTYYFGGGYVGQGVSQHGTWTGNYVEDDQPMNPNYANIIIGGFLGGTGAGSQRLALGVWNNTLTARQFQTFDGVGKVGEVLISQNYATSGNNDGQIGFEDDNTSNFYFGMKYYHAGHEIQFGGVSSSNSGLYSGSSLGSAIGRSSMVSSGLMWADGIWLTDKDGNNRRMLKIGDAAPTSGEYATGDIILYNGSDTSKLMFRCIAGGTPGTWATITKGTGGGGGGSSPAGNSGNVQLNVGGVFGTPGSDTLNYSSTGGFRVKNHAVIFGQLKVGDNWIMGDGYDVDINRAYSAVNARLINNSTTAASELFVVNSAGNTGFRFGYYPSGYSTSGMQEAGKSVLMSINTGMNFGTYTNHSVDIYSNNTLRGQILGGGDLLWTNNIGVGGTPDASAKVDIQSTTQGFLPPRMTTTQRTAISSPAEGLCVYDLTLHKLYVYDGTTWNAAW